MTDKDILEQVNELLKNSRPNKPRKILYIEKRLDKKWHVFSYPDLQEVSEHSSWIKANNSIRSKNSGFKAYFMVLE